jgi:hypothetical protein
MNPPLGRATKFEYHYRFLILALIYLSTYALYGLDHRNLVWALGHWYRAHPIPLDRQVFSFAAPVAGMGKPAEAVATFQRTLDLATATGLFPYQLEARLGLGEMRLQTGQVKAAEAILAPLEKEAVSKEYFLIARKAAR